MSVRKDLVLIALLVSILALMVIPLPSGMIDVLLAVNISLSVMLLMVAVYLKRPSDFSTFPSVILIATVFRLALSIATTRLILSEADAGAIIATFGDFVVRGSVVIGLVIFLIITVVQFVVVTKGAERVAEVAARFTLDAMPGKQMAIEADIRAGTLDQAAGAKKRIGLDKDSQFFGAMDGAMKFVKGDAIAGLIIIFINLLGGIAVGTSVHGYTLGEAASIYSLLTVGDGLVAQIPALMMALCAGTIVTRVANEGSKDLGNDIVKELLSDARVPAAASMVVFCFGFVPGFPFRIFAATAAALFIASIIVRRTLLKEANAKSQEAEVEIAAEEDDYAAEGLVKLAVCDRIGIRFSVAAAEQLDVKRIEIELTHRVTRFSARYGITIPRPFIAVDKQQDGTARFHIEMDEVPLKSGVIEDGVILTNASVNQLRALNIDEVGKVLDWLDATSPYRTVPAAAAPKLADAGLVSLSYEQAIAEDLFRQQERHIGKLFSKAAYEALMSEAVKIDEELVGEITAAQNATNLTMVFRYLLEDGVPLRPMRLLIESLAHWIHLHDDPNPVFLAECLRTSLRRQMCQNIASHDGEIGVVMLAPALQERIVNDLKSIKKASGGAEVNGLPLNPSVTNLLTSEARALRDLSTEPGRRIVIVTSPEIRRRLRDFLANAGLNFPVIAPHEISDDVVTVPIKVIGEDYADKQAQQTRTRPAAPGAEAAKPRIAKDEPV